MKMALRHGLSPVWKWIFNWGRRASRQNPNLSN
jgi:hypothetical protein